MNTEIWRDIPGHEGKYQASTLGRIRSLDSYSSEFINNGTPCRQFKAGRIMKANHDPDGYLNISLSIGNSRYKYYRVHRLIALTFLPTDDTSLQIDHINGIKDDNRVDNLEWVSCKENINRAWRSGRCKPAEVTPEKIERFRQLGRRSPLWAGKPCRCVEDNKCFLSATAAANHYGLEPAWVQERIRTQNTHCAELCRGLHFEHISKSSQEYIDLVEEFNLC